MNRSIWICTVLLAMSVWSAAQGQTYTILHSFDRDPYYYYPQAAPTISGSTMYGFTYQGGATNGGTLFTANTDGSGFQNLLSFGGTTGVNPCDSLTLSDSILYGTTNLAGAYGNGTVFSIPTSGGNPTILLAFNGANGRTPNGGVTLNGSTLYGTTVYGGAYDSGTVFAIPTSGGTPTTLLSFNGTNGKNPGGTLALSGSTLYGTAMYGGAYGTANGGFGYGTIFSVSTSASNPTTLASFDGIGNDGKYPTGTLVLSGSALYGMTNGGGDSGVGTIFRMLTSGGTPQTLASFNGFDGAYPFGGLTLSADGSTLYGATQRGGDYGYGTIFSMPVTGGDPTLLFSFDGTNGAYPQGTLTLGPDGSTLYGMTLWGGAHNDGTVFSFTVPEPSTFALLAIGSAVLLLLGSGRWWRGN